MRALALFLIAVPIYAQVTVTKTLGGSATTFATALAHDSQGNLYVTGFTNAPDFPVVNAFQPRLGNAPLFTTTDGTQTWTSQFLGGASIVNVISFASSTGYAGTNVGIFRSTNGGASWTAAPSTGLSGTPSSLAVDPATPTTVYAATPDGLFGSTDSAATFRALANGLPAKTPVAAIAVDPNRSATLYASVQNPTGLYRSTDSGASWTLVSLGPPLQSPFVTTIAFGSDAVYLATSGGIYLSTDSGATFALTSSEPAYGSQSLVVSPANSATLFLASPFSGLLRSTDSGRTLKPVLPDVHFSVTPRVAFDPRNPSTVYAVDYNLIYRSTDSGDTWTKLTFPYAFDAHAFAVSPADSRLLLGSVTRNNAFVAKLSPDGTRILYSTFLGGSGSDGPSALAVDSTGAAYVTGAASSPDFPTTPGAPHSATGTTFVAKLSPDGSQLVYSTVLNDTGVPSALAVDRSGNAILAGRKIVSGDRGCTVQLPLEIGHIEGDAWVAKLSATGAALVYSTTLGGKCYTQAGTVAVDSTGNAWIGGSTTDPALPVTSDAFQSKHAGGFYDAVLARVGPSGSVDYATYFGGEGYDAISALTLDSAGSLYLAGQSEGTPGRPTTVSCTTFNIGPAVYSPQGNAFVLKFDSGAHSVQRFTYLGVPGCLIPRTIAVDSTGAPWVAGSTGANPNLPTANILMAAGPSFLTRFNADLSQLQVSSYFDAIAGLVVDPAFVAASKGTDAFYVARIDVPNPSVSLDAILAAPQGIAPGEFLRLTGRNLAPSTAPGIIRNGVLATTVGGVQVTFDGIAVPLLSTAPGEIDLMAPFAIKSSSTTIQIVNNTQKSNAVLAAVTPLAPQILGVYNSDFTPNTAANPAAPGSILTVYVAGVGQTSPASVDGQVNAAPLPAPAAGPVQVEWFINNPNGRTQLPVSFAAAAAGLAAGIFQVNFQAPPQSVPLLTLSVGPAVVALPVYIAPPAGAALAAREPRP